MTPIAERLAVIARHLLDSHPEVAREISAMTVEISRLERERNRSATLLPFPTRPDVRLRGE